jgi:hypothetical protein
MGKFYEGIMTTGVTDDATDDAVHANILAVGYKEVPLPPVPPATALGCYHDKLEYDLPVRAIRFMETEDPLEECGRLCLGYKYFALENGHECRCGNSFGKYGKASNCSTPCKNDPTVMCGGTWLENVYSH